MVAPPFRFPHCLAFTVAHEPDEGWTVHTAMTIVPGDSLDVYYRLLEGGEVKEEVGANGSGRNKQTFAAGMRRACALVRKLFRDIGPCLQRLEPTATVPYP